MTSPKCTTPSLDAMTEQLLDALPTFTQEEQRLALTLYRLLAAGDPLSKGRLAESLGLSVH